MFVFVIDMKATFNICLNFSEREMKIEVMKTSPEVTRGSV